MGTSSKPLGRMQEKEADAVSLAEKLTLAETLFLIRGN